jgi:hypothetical protein
MLDNKAGMVILLGMKEERVILSNGLNKVIDLKWLSIESKPAHRVYAH